MIQSQVLAVQCNKPKDKKRSVTFNDKNMVRFYHIGNYDSFETILQPCNESFRKDCVAHVYFMSSAATLDFSTKELFYTAYDSTPLANEIWDEEFYDSEDDKSPTFYANIATMLKIKETM